MKISKSKMEEISIKLNFFVQKIKNIYPNELKEFETPKLNYDLKGKCAGQAVLMKNVIKLNYELINNTEYYNRMIEETLPHELAHLVVFFLFKNSNLPFTSNFKPKPHGNEWKKVMLELGIEPNRTHNMQVKSNKRSWKITYICNCSEHKISKNNHNKIINGLVSYNCKKCKNKLVLKEGAVLELGYH